MTPDQARHLRCPHDGGEVVLDGRTLGCAAGHRFDLARQGYVNLTGPGGHPGTGDDAAMVAARVEVFEAGHLAPLSDALAAAVADAIPAGGDGAVVDLGAGTGHHLAAVLDRLPGRVGLALDLSRYAARRAARIHPRVGSVVCDVWQPLPVRDATADAVLCAFSPRGGAEIGRVLRPEAVAVVATPTPHHLAELVGPLGLLTVDTRKDERLAATLADLTPVARHVHEHRVRLDHAAVRAVVAMGPSAHHLDVDTLVTRLDDLPDVVEATVSVSIGTYRRA